MSHKQISGCQVLVSHKKLHWQNIRKVSPFAEAAPSCYYDMSSKFKLPMTHTLATLNK